MGLARPSVRPSLHLSRMGS